ncbi:transmembrane protein, putative (macronuclear) [Tetrahymena thermophila SB210]|uniref:Transmembrane protein, putative n=1 Tax=Tetrahymena thermophila (strain SB210) TaxID=312017 RepID=W7WXS2_TETTS|nr:transmembrane protein, putative [Tetrahymena thermophila SB210]EWS71635.1 transmembrane protein, putative [Tetrahymena thermophila SB210]|eukprot:XP_012655830.1 transmembrane protein, putative [Tetrahymena thermophila SB210]
MHYILWIFVSHIQIKNQKNQFLNKYFFYFNFQFNFKTSITFLNLIILDYSNIILIHIIVHYLLIYLLQINKIISIFLCKMVMQNLSIAKRLIKIQWYGNLQTLIRLGFQIKIIINFNNTQYNFFIFYQKKNASQIQDYVNLFIENVQKICLNQIYFNLNMNQNHIFYIYSLNYPKKYKKINFSKKNLQQKYLLIKIIFIILKKEQQLVEFFQI